MYSKRVIPCLLLRGNGLIKTRKFKDPLYIGDPVNAVRIFSEKEVDEIIVLDIEASLQGREPNYELISEIAGECFMPITYGGGINSLNHARKLIRLGVEKVVINSAAYSSLEIISEIANVFGSQAVVAAIDVKKKLIGGYKLFSNSGTKEINVTLEDHVLGLAKSGAGELFINSIDNDGQMQGYDIDLIKKTTKIVNIPVTICGGAGSVEHFKMAFDAGASAAAAASLFMFYGKHKAVLINYRRE
jgi:cyclase